MRHVKLILPKLVRLFAAIWRGLDSVSGLIRRMGCCVRERPDIS